MDFSNITLISNNFWPQTFLNIDSEDHDIIENDVYSYLNSIIELFFTKNLSECYDNCKVLLDLIWEKLNTGHWKDVSLHWRKAYTSTSCLAALSQFFLMKESQESKTTSESSETLNKNVFDQSKVRSIIKTCDMGLLMGYPMDTDILASLASHVHIHYLTEMTKIYDNSPEVEVENASSSKCVTEYEPASKKFKDNMESIEYIDSPSLFSFK